eukprot:1144123-Pelagomonas_calceolata.AAC.5
MRTISSLPILPKRSSTSGPSAQEKFTRKARARKQGLRGLQVRDQNELCQHEIARAHELKHRGRRLRSPTRKCKNHAALAPLYRSSNSEAGGEERM